MGFLNRRKKQTIEDLVSDYQTTQRKKAEMINRSADIRRDALYGDADEAFEQIKKLDFEIDLAESALQEIRRLARTELEAEIQRNHDSLPKLKQDLAEITDGLESTAGEALGKAIGLLFAGDDKHVRLAKGLSVAFNSVTVDAALQSAFSRAVAAPPQVGNLKALSDRIKKAESRTPGSPECQNYIERRLISLGFGTIEQERAAKWSLSKVA